MKGEQTGWRLLMMIGAIPALLTFFIRIMVPESERWVESESRGATSHWATRDMLGVIIGACGAIAIIWLWLRILRKSVSLRASSVRSSASLSRWSDFFIRCFVICAVARRQTERTYVRRHSNGCCWARA